MCIVVPHVRAAAGPRGAGEAEEAPGLRAQVGGGALARAHVLATKGRLQPHPDAPPAERADAPPQTAEIIALLYEATQAPLSLDDAPALNPTGGVKGKAQLSRLSFQKDGTRPGGGVFVAKGPISDRELLEKLPEGTLIKDDGSVAAAGGGGSGTHEGEAPDVVSSGSRSSNDPPPPAPLPAPPPPPPPSNAGPPIRRGAPPPPAAFNGAAAVSPWAFAGSTSAQQQVAQQQQQHQGQGQGRAGPPMVNFAALEFPNMNPALNNSLAAPENVQVVNMLDHPLPNNMNIMEQQAMSDSLLEGIPGAMFDWGACPSPQSFFSLPLSALACRAREGRGLTCGALTIFFLRVRRPLIRPRPCRPVGKLLRALPPPAGLPRGRRDGGRAAAPPAVAAGRPGAAVLPRPSRRRHVSGAMLSRAALLPPSTVGNLPHERTAAADARGLGLGARGRAGERAWGGAVGRMVGSGGHARASTAPSAAVGEVGRKKSAMTSSAPPAAAAVAAAFARLSRSAFPRRYSSPPSHLSLVPSLSRVTLVSI